MADTNFINNVTLTDADWFNDLNRLHYTIFGDPADAAAAKAAMYTLASQAEAQAGTENTKLMTALRVAEAIAAQGGLLMGTETAAGGTTTTFTGIPSGVIRVTVNFQGWSTNGTSPWLIQIGDSGGIENSGYSSAAGSGSGAAANTSGFMVHEGPASAAAYSGRIVLERVNTAATTWIATSMIIDASAATGIRIGGGQKSLTTELTQLRFIAANGTDVSDAGTLNITYE
jgi:hypothetical protein